MTATTSEYRLVDVETSEEQLLFCVADDPDDLDYTPVIEISRDGKWKVPDDGYIPHWTRITPSAGPSGGTRPSAGS